MSTSPKPWRVVATPGYATVVDSSGNQVDLLTDLELGWTDTATGAYHDPAKSLEMLEHIVSCVNAAGAIEMAFIISGKVGANADVNHPLRPFWETARRIVNLMEASPAP